ncbi:MULTISPECIES: hypothetical protein [unclassified Gilliamella]|uniref:hypothetical protein n=1 Tax=unclassified Gilliamella TaxID=2685620 RepID=UPI001146E691|nr:MULTISPECIES: hypothetical protein [Gilliamella]
MMSKYNFQFKQYNWIKKSLDSEENTLNNIKENYLDNNLNKDELELIKNPKKWAEYAFSSLNHQQYYVTIFAGETPLACINNSFYGIDISFLEFNHEGELVKYLWMVYNRYNMDLYFKTNKLINWDDNNLFLSQVEVTKEDIKNKIHNKALFKYSKKLLKWTSVLNNKQDGTYKREDKETKVNLTGNFIRSPKHYLDYEYLLDYQNILKPGYLNLP